MFKLDQLSLLTSSQWENKTGKFFQWTESLGFIVSFFRLNEVYSV